MTGAPSPVQHRAAVLGSPVAHSLSPVLHRAAYQRLGLTDWSYEAIDVDQGALPGFLDGLDGSWAGLSLTMPLKAAVVALVDHVSPTVEASGVANTVLLRGDGRHADNTDVPALAAALHASGCGPVEHVAVFGGGATARSTLVALAEVTGSVRAYVRDLARRTELEAVAARVRIRLDVRSWADAAEGLAAPLVVNTTPTGAADALAAAVPARVGVLLDVRYDPWPTPLTRAWSARSGPVVDGLELLVRQAVLQVGLMTGSVVDAVDAVGADELVTLMRAAGIAALRG